MIARGDVPPFGTLVDELQIETAGITEESRVGHVLVDHSRLERWIDGDVTARQRDEGQPVTGEQVA